MLLHQYEQSVLNKRNLSENLLFTRIKFFFFTFCEIVVKDARGLFLVACLSVCLSICLFFYFFVFLSVCLFVQTLMDG
jgi:hypothetical protein